MSFPPAVREFITSTRDVQADGNCGYRVVAAFVKGDENRFIEVRRDLLLELNGNVQLYINLFGDIRRVVEIGDMLSHFDESGVAPFSKWMTMPDMGHLIASAYNMAVFHLSDCQCITFLPLRTAPPAPPTPLKELGIGFVNGNHFIQVLMKQGYPVPPVTKVWNRFSAAVAYAWEAFYIQRGRQFVDVVGKSVATSETVELDSP